MCIFFYLFQYKVKALPLPNQQLQPARVSRRPTPARGPVRQALVGALIGAVLEEMGPMGVARPRPATTPTAPRPKKAPRVNAQG